MREHMRRGVNHMKEGMDGTEESREGWTYISCGVAYSAGLWEMPPLQGMKIIDVGKRRAV